MLERTYSLKDINNDLGISIRALREYVSRGILPAKKIGRAYVVTPDGLESFLKTDAAISRQNDKCARSCVRNYLCMHYDTCLYEAARENRLFDCAECDKFIRADKIVISKHELAGMLSLWESVFGSQVFLK